MNSFIVRHPSYFESNESDSVKACVKAYISSFNIGDIIERKRMSEILTIIVDDMKRKSRSLVNVNFMNKIDPYSPMHLKMQFNPLPMHVPFTNFIPVDINKPISVIDKEGLTISPPMIDQYTDRMSPLKLLQKLSLMTV